MDERNHIGRGSTIEESLCNGYNACSLTEQSPEPARMGTDQTQLTGIGAQWLNLALSIEERQYVLIFA